MDCVGGGVGGRGRRPRGAEFDKLKDDDDTVDADADVQYWPPADGSSKGADSDLPGVGVT